MLGYCVQLGYAVGNCNRSRLESLLLMRNLLEINFEMKTFVSEGITNRMNGYRVNFHGLEGVVYGHSLPQINNTVKSSYHQGLMSHISVCEWVVHCFLYIDSWSLKVC